MRFLRPEKGILRCFTTSNGLILLREMNHFFDALALLPHGEILKRMDQVDFKHRLQDLPPRAGRKVSSRRTETAASETTGCLMKVKSKATHFVRTDAELDRQLSNDEAFRSDRGYRPHDPVQIANRWWPRRPPV